MLHNASKSINMKGQLTLLMVSSLVLSMGQLVASQFLQPQSHLGRLVQSITSPLALTSALSSAAAETDPSEGSSYDPETMNLRHVNQPRLGHSQRDQQPASHYLPEEAGQHFQHYRRQPMAHAANVPLQQAPSRGIPQRYYSAQSSADNSADDDEGAQMGPSSTGSGQAFRHQPQQQQPAAAVANEQYQMGAYLGPTIDDKEIQGAFNSNDDRDDDDAPGYDGPPRGVAGGWRQDAAANAYMTSQPLEGAGSYGRPNGGGRDRSLGAQPSGGFDDESNVDEDDAGETSPRQRQPRRFRQSGRMSQAASHYRDDSQQHDGGPQSQSGSMMTAANGYSPMGSSPFDLSSLMAAAAAAGNGQTFEVYSGDGSYPGYNPQQQQRQQGRRSQAASMQNPYGYNQMNGNQNQQRGAADVDDVDSDGDED